MKTTQGLNVNLLLAFKFCVNPTTRRRDSRKTIFKMASVRILRLWSFDLWPLETLGIKIRINMPNGDG